jgi:Uma2 family endonuclease
MPDRDTHRFLPGAGPMTVDQLREGDRYELDQGRPIYVAPTGGDGTWRVMLGGQVINTDPRVKKAGVEPGFALDEHTLRAPDIGVGNIPDAPGWIKGAPLLAVEYASTGQDEAQLQVKIRQLLAAGTCYVWVVRLLGTRRVEVYESGKPMRVAQIGEELAAPEVLQNPIPVEAMFDPAVAHELTLRNLLQRKGYRDLEDVRETERKEGLEEGRQQGLKEGREQGQVQGLLSALQTILSTRGLALGPAEAERMASCRDVALLERWLGRAMTALAAAEVFE